MDVNHTDTLTFPIDDSTHTFLYEIWYSFAEEIFNRVVKHLDLDEDRIRELKRVALRPNDFIICST